MYPIFSFLHFFGMSFLLGGEVLIAAIAIKAAKDDSALTFFVGFLKGVAAFMWAGTALAVVGGIGMVAIHPEFAGTTAFTVKLALVALVVAVALVMGVKIGKVQEGFSRLGVAMREDASYKTLDILSRVNLFAVVAIALVSTQV